MADLLYRFEESGVGCEAHASTDCLCDVTPIPGGVPVRVVPESHHYPSGMGNEALQFIVWASGTLGRFEALIGVNETELNEALGIWEGRFGGSRRGSHRIKAAHQCVKAGLTFEQTARWLSTSLVEILDLFYPRERHQLILEMEKHIRAGKTAQQVAEATGCTQSYASDVARRWGVKLPHSVVRYTPADRAKARRMVRSGLSRREVGRRLAISESRVTTWCSDLPGIKNGKVKPK